MSTPTLVGRFDPTTGTWLVTGEQAEALPAGASVIPHEFSNGNPFLPSSAYVRGNSGWFGRNGHRHHLDNLTYRVLHPAPFPPAGGVVAPAHGREAS